MQFTSEKPPPIKLYIIGIPVPPSKKRKRPQKLPNCHIPSKKNNKMLTRRGPITKPEYQEWTENAVQHLESQLLSRCQTASGETRLEPLKLSAILSQLPADDSVNDLTRGDWTVEMVDPGNEGAVVTIERLT